MSTSNPNDNPLAARVAALEQLLQANPLRNAAVERGMLEFYANSMLLIRDSNMRVVGVAYVEGRLEGEGTFSWSGPTLLDGSVEITNTLDVLASTRLRGETTIEGVTRLLSELVVEGKLTAGGVRIENDRLYIGEQMVLDPATDGGAATFGNGSKLYSNVTAIGLRKGNSSVTIGDTLAAMLVGGKALTVTEDGIALTGLREVTSADGLKWLGITNTGEVVKVDPAVGGPMGNLTWPFPPSTVTSEYGPRESPGEGASTFHEGIDFGASNGTPIPAAGSGLVEFAGFDTDGGYGNYVLINHGNGVKTRSAHMNATPPVSAGSHVARGQIIGAVGNTGTSFGNHLHFEVEVNGVRVNPRSKLPAA